MTRDEEALRRVLHAAADSIEPAADGLIRIRERVAARRRTRSVVKLLLDWFSDDRPRHARHRSLWRRPTVAIGAVVLVAAAAGIAMSGLPAEISQNVTPSSASHAEGSSGGNGSNGLNGSGQPYGSAPAGKHGRSRRPTASPAPSCLRSASSCKVPHHTIPTPSPTPGASPTPTPSPTPSPTPTPCPTPTPGPTPSPTPPPCPTPTDTATGPPVSNAQFSTSS